MTARKPPVELPTSGHLSTHPEKFQRAVLAAGWTAEQYDAHVEAIIAEAPPLPPAFVRLMRHAAEQRKATA